jgi:restriction endonuclease S subunit
MWNSGWQIKSLSEITEIIGGGTPKTNNSAYWNGDIVWLSPTDLPKIGDIVNVSDSKHKITKLGLEKSSAQLLPKGSIVFSSRASIGKIGIADIELCTNQGFANFICNANVYNKFLAYALKKYTPEITALSNSTTFAEVSKSSLKSFSIPVPSRQEQRRIVAKLDSLFARIDRAVALVEQNIANAQHLMASVLNGVFESLMGQNGIKPVQELSHNIQYGFTGKTSEQGSFKYLRITDIQNSKVDWSSTPFAVIAEHEARKYLLQKGDIVFARTGATTGKSYLFVDKVPSIFASYLIRVVVKQDLILPEFLYLFFQSPNYWKQVMGKVVGAAQPNVNGQKLAEVSLPVPTITKQTETIHYLAFVQERQRFVVELQQKRLLELTALKSSLLDTAFKGEI